MPINNKRLAGQIFTDDSALNSSGQEVLDYVSARTGKKSNVKPIDFKDSRLAGFFMQPESTGGFVFHNEPETAYVNPNYDRQDYILAHELGHSQARTPLDQLHLRRLQKYNSPFEPSQNPETPFGLDRFDRSRGSTFRHLYENTAAPVVIEESNAQGIATGAMSGLGRSTKDPSYADPKDYPLGIGMNRLNELNFKMGTSTRIEKDPYTGKSLAKEDEYGNVMYPEMPLPASFLSKDISDTVYQIDRNLRPRIQRQFNLGNEFMRRDPLNR